MSVQNTLGYNEFPVPIATVMSYAGQIVPAGWLKCDSTSYLTTDYPDLFSAIGDTFTNVVAGTIDIDATGAIGSAIFSQGTTLVVGQTINFPELLFGVPNLTAAILTWNSATNSGTCTLQGLTMIFTPFDTVGLFEVPNLVEYPYIVGVDATHIIPANPYQDGSLTSATTITLAANNIPSLSAANFDVADFTVTPTIAAYLIPQGGENVAVGNPSINCFKTETSTTGAVGFSVGGQIAVTNNAAQTPIPFAANVTMASLSLYYIIKARWSPPPTIQTPQVFEVVNNWYLQDHSATPTTNNAVVWDKQIGGFQYNKNFQNIL